MAKRIPPDAFDFYFSLGPDRSYERVAEKYGVSKRSVTSRAKRDNWQRRIQDVEAKARETSDRKKAEELDAAQERHRKALRLVFAKGVDGLSRMVISSPADALRAIRMAIQEERVALGEPTERTAISIEDTIKREYQRWMVSNPEPPERKKDDDDDDEEIAR